MRIPLTPEAGNVDLDRLRQIVSTRAELRVCQMDFDHSALLVRRRKPFGSIRIRLHTDRIIVRPQSYPVLLAIPLLAVYFGALFAAVPVFRGMTWLHRAPESIRYLPPIGWVGACSLGLLALKQWLEALTNRELVCQTEALLREGLFGTAEE